MEDGGDGRGTSFRLHAIPDSPSGISVIPEFDHGIAQIPAMADNIHRNSIFIKALENKLPHAALAFTCPPCRPGVPGVHFRGD